MSTPLQSSTSPASATQESAPSGWLKLGAVAAASALAGGLAAAWWYRKTLIKLRHHEENCLNTDLRISGEDSQDEI
jgi:hypothetical protein